MTQLIAAYGRTYTDLDGKRGLGTISLERGVYDYVVSITNLNGVKHTSRLTPSLDDAQRSYANAIDTLRYVATH